MLKKALAVVALSLPVFFSTVSKSQSACVEVSLSTCVGDFANGGEYETGNRLLGNASGYSLGFIQDNKVRIHLSSGSSSIAGATNTATAGFVGIHGKLPQHHLDVWGRLRSTGSAILASANGNVAIGVNGSMNGSKVDVSGGSITVRGSNAGIIVVDGVSEISGGTLKFPTTSYIEFSFPFAVGNSTNAVSSSTNPLNGMGLLDGNTSTTGANTAFYQYFVPSNFIAGSTPVLVAFMTLTTGAITVEESWVLSFATQTGMGLPIAPDGSSTAITFSSMVVVNVTGTAGSNGGARLYSTAIPLNGVTNMIGSGSCVLYIRAVRDGLADASNVRSAAKFFIAFKLQQ